MTPIEPGFANRENMPDQGKLSLYAELIRAWAPKLDLVSPQDLNRLEERHIHDSLRVLGLVMAAPEGPCCDVGSGAGLPGIPLAVASGRHWRLLEPRSRRAAFLEEVVRELELDCEVLRQTAEQASRSGLTHAVATARALAPPAEAFGLIMPLVAPGGVGIVFHGPGAKLPAAAESWSDGIATLALTSQEEQ